MRQKNVDWTNGDKDNTSYDQAKLAVLMDLRDELQAIRRWGECYRIQYMFRTLERIDKKLGPLKPRKRKKAR